jgi:drug/metabolite transporter (DMT)-like permease
VSARAWTLFAAVSTIWGVPYLLIKIAVDGGVPPLVLAWGRIVVGAAVLLALGARAGVLHGLRRRWRPLLAYAVVEVSIPFPFIAAGERHVASSLAAIIVAAVPLIVALMALRFDADERATPERLTGLLIGLLGVALLVGVDASGSLAALLGAAAVLVGAVGYSAGPLIYKRHLGDLDPRAAMGASLAIAGVLLTPLAALSAPTRAPSAGALASVVVLGLVCTALGFVLMALLIGEIGPARAVVITYVNPVIAVALGVTLLGERPGAGGVAGLLLILAGSWLSTDGRLPPGLRPRLQPRPRPAQSVQKSGSISPSPPSGRSLPIAISSRPSLPASNPRATGGATRKTSHWRSSTVSSSRRTRPEPEITT